MTVARATASGSKSVSIVDFSFKPGTITVNSGDTVQWTNNGSVPEGHDVTGDGLDSGLLHSGHSYSHTFSQPGSVSYICTIHPSMKGTVKVLGRSAGSSEGKQGSGGSGGSGISGDQSGSSSAAAPTESSPAAAGSSSDGSSGSLPSTGEDSQLLATMGLLLLDLGFAVRILTTSASRRRG